MLTIFLFFVWGHVQLCMLVSESVGGCQRSYLFLRVPEVCFRENRVANSGNSIHQPLIALRLLSVPLPAREELVRFGWHFRIVSRFYTSIWILFSWFFGKFGGIPNPRLKYGMQCLAVQSPPKVH